MIEHLNFLDGQIAERSKRIAVLQRQLLELQAELRVYQEMRDRLAGEAAPPRRQSRAPSESGASGRRKLGALSRVLVTAAVRAYPETVSTDDGVRIASAQMGKPVPRSNVRASFWANSNAKLLERLSDGVFRATIMGAELIGEPLGARHNTNGVNAASQTEGVAGEDGGGDHPSPI